MAEEFLNDSLPELKELENKIGRKTPESLLVWMKDAADCGDCWSSDVGERSEHASALGDSFSDKISNLKQEMRWLRSADVRILRQLVAVHEGIEAMRWLMEERGALASRGSSLTGSLSSLVTLEDPGASMSPWRESPSPTCLYDLAETAGEESTDHPPRTGNDPSDRKNYFNVLCPESTEARPPSPPNSKYEVSYSAQASSSPANGLVSSNLPKSQPQDSDAAPSQDIKGGADPIRRALQRSCKASRRDVKMSSFALTQQSAKTKTEEQTLEGLSVAQNNMTEENKSTPDRENLLLGYDAQWCWVESQDDVTFL
ncbi:leucine rich adaptor protein 1-like [Scomber scombrus]|uniref:Leucine rich adaptor protein 1-like n=1 Tax=Scomber scombrus TaxID=13677 RepID=A0AAV1MYY0_SCOSC|nr:leucine rich adaptor protein 1-like [Scomber scombrus]